jgi:signal transduction histidine kinase
MFFARASWRRGLGFRLNAWYAGVFAAMLALAVLGSELLARHAIDEEQRATLSLELERHRVHIEGRGLGQLDRFVAQRRARASLRWFVRISDGEGRTLIYDTPEQLDFAPGAMTPSERPRTIVSRGPEHTGPWRLASARVLDSLWLQIGIDDGPRQQLLARITRSLWLLLAAGLTVGVAGGLGVTRRALTPIRRLTETCRQIVDSGDVSLRVPVREPSDELGQLSSSFNRVLDRNQRLVEGMRQALDNVAHDLRTPLSRLRSGAELALQRESSAPGLREALSDCIEESERAAQMLRTLMDISEAESGVMQLRREPVALGSVAEDAVDLYQHVAEQHGVRLTLVIERDVPVLGDRQRLLRALANLLDNALKYTDAPGQVEVTVSHDDARAWVAVQDSGVGIAADQLDKIWQRLYRADASRSRAGLGLGLSFVNAIVEAHRGRVRVASRPGQGSTFSIELPLASEP